MPKANLYNMAGEQVGEVELSEAVFGIEPNEIVLHAAIKNHLANCRQGTQSALTKGEVSYTTAKPWRQKGTGRARAGYKGSPVWTHGGVAFAPKPRDCRARCPSRRPRARSSWWMVSASTRSRRRPALLSLRSSAPRTP